MSCCHANTTELLKLSAIVELCLIVEVQLLNFVRLLNPTQLKLCSVVETCSITELCFNDGVLTQLFIIKVCPRMGQWAIYDNVNGEGLGI
jgi:hypothetical protein